MEVTALGCLQRIAYFSELGLPSLSLSRRTALLTLQRYALLKLNLEQRIVSI